MGHPRDPLVVPPARAEDDAVSARRGRGSRRRRVLAAGLTLGLTGLAVLADRLGAHDLFLKPEAFFVAPGQRVTVAVLNGTFTTSEAVVTRDRLRDLSVVTPSGRVAGDTTAWVPDTARAASSASTAAGKRTRWTVPVGDAGTYVLGASLSPRLIALSAADFNQYLAEDGLPDVLAARRASHTLDRPARERYSKHVKALVQVGDTRGADVGARLGYPAELIPLDNPYALRPGGILRVRALVDGAPVANQTVLAGGRTAGGARLPAQSTRTDRDGVARVRLARGVWYVKFIRMVPASPGDSVDYESKWATLTFAVR